MGSKGLGKQVQMASLQNVLNLRDDQQRGGVDEFPSHFGREQTDSVDKGLQG
jgi:hypothetical protein